MAVIPVINCILLFVDIDIVLITNYIFLHRNRSNQQREIKGLLPLFNIFSHKVIARSGLNFYVYNILMDERLEIGLSTMINKLLNHFFYQPFIWL